MSLPSQNHKARADIKIPAEWERQSALWTAWPSHPDLWEGNLEPARNEIADMIRAVSEGQKVKVLAMGAEACVSAKNALGGAAEIFDVPFGDIWLRDTGPVFSGDGRALRFKTNGWGGKYQLPFDDAVGDEIAKLAGAEVARHDFILEGGAVEHNGAGVILTTRQCVLNPNRNVWAESEAEKALKSAFGAGRVCWLDEGLMNDHTDGHIDNIARFVGENKVVCQSGFGDDDPNAALYEKIAQDLSAMGLEVVQLPSPGRITDDEGVVMPASHMNFIIANDVVVMPAYGAASASDATAVLTSLFPDRKTIALPSNALLSGGGSFHCITQQVPA